MLTSAAPVKGIHGGDCKETFNLILIGQLEWQLYVIFV